MLTRDFSSIYVMLQRHYNLIQHCTIVMPADFSAKIITYIYIFTKYD